MNEAEWLSAIQDRIAQELPAIEVTSPDENTLGMIVDTLAIVITVQGNRAFLARSVSAGSTIQARMASHVRHLDPLAFAVSEQSVTDCAAAIVKHLQGAAR